jgi:hypothetical protein
VRRRQRGWRCPRRETNRPAWRRRAAACVSAGILRTTCRRLRGGSPTCRRHLADQGLARGAAGVAAVAPHARPGQCLSESPPAAGPGLDPPRGRCSGWRRQQTNRNHRRRRRCRQRRRLRSEAVGRGAGGLLRCLSLLLVVQLRAASAGSAPLLLALATADAALLLGRGTRTAARVCRTGGRAGSRRRHAGSRLGAGHRGVETRLDVSESLGFGREGALSLELPRLPQGGVVVAGREDGVACRLQSENVRTNQGGPAARRQCQPRAEEGGRARHSMPATARPKPSLCAVPSLSVAPRAESACRQCPPRAANNGHARASVSGAPAR